MDSDRGAGSDADGHRAWAHLSGSLSVGALDEARDLPLAAWLQEPPRAWAYGVGAILVFPVVLWSHPTNVFIAPFLLLPFVTAIRPLAGGRSAQTMLLVSGALLMVLGLLSSLALEHVAGTNDYVKRPWLSVAAARLIDGRQWFDFAANGARLLNGVTVYHYFSGARPLTLPYDAAVVIVAGGALRICGQVRAGRDPLARRADSRVRGHVARLLRVRRSPGAPPALRAMGLVPHRAGTLVLARGPASWIESSPRIRWPAIAAATLVASCLLDDLLHQLLP